MVAHASSKVLGRAVRIGGPYFGLFNQMLWSEVHYLPSILSPIFGNLSTVQVLAHPLPCAYLGKECPCTPPKMGEPHLNVGAGTFRLKLESGGGESNPVNQTCGNCGSLALSLATGLIHSFLAGTQHQVHMYTCRSPAQKGGSKVGQVTLGERSYSCSLFGDQRPLGQSC